MELGTIASIRFSFSGSRKVWMCPVTPLLKFLEKRSGKRIFGKTLLTWLKTAEATAILQEYSEAQKDEHQPQQCTVGPSDLLFVPATWIFVEQLSSGADGSGVQYRMASADSLTLMEEYQALLTEFESKPNKTLDKIINFIIMSS